MALPVAHVINLDRCPDNWAQMQTTWSSIFNLQRVSAIDGRAYGYSGREACRMSHIVLLKKLSSRTEPFQIVLEDDVYPTGSFSTQWPAILKFLNSGRCDWDFIVLDPIVQYENPQLDVFTPELFTITGSRATGGIIYRTEFLKEHITTIAKARGAIDMSLTQNRAFRKLTPQQLLVRQHAGKPSLTSGTQDTTYYNDFYDNTEAYLAAARAIQSRLD